MLQTNCLKCWRCECLGCLRLRFLHSFREKLSRPLDWATSPNVPSISRPGGMCASALNTDKATRCVIGILGEGIGTAASQSVSQSASCRPKIEREEGGASSRRRRRRRRRSPVKAARAPAWPRGEGTGIRKSCLVLSCLVLSCLVLSCLVLPEGPILPEGLSVTLSHSGPDAVGQCDGQSFW